MKNINRDVIGIVGTGLIGTSLALALKDRDPKQNIIGCDINEAHVRLAIEKGVFNGFKKNPLELARHSDILVIATPIGAIRGIFEQIESAVDRIIITDVGSVKCSVIADACSVWGKVPACVVPAHPIAGGENSGPTAASKDLFASRYVFLTPEEGKDKAAVNVVRGLWQQVGAKIEILSATRHDELFAATSHLPHVVAYALISSLEQAEVNTVFSAGGLKDFTRIASSDPAMWRDIFIANRTPILGSIRAFEQSIAEIRKMIEHEQSDRLLELLEKTVSEKKKLNLKD